MTGGTNGQTNGQTNERKSPVFYRTSSPSGPLPKKQKKEKEENKMNEMKRRMKFEELLLHFKDAFYALTAGIHHASLKV